MDLVHRSAQVRDAVAAGEPGWRALAERHGGLVKPDIVFFGEVTGRKDLAFAMSHKDGLGHSDATVATASSARWEGRIVVMPWHAKRMLRRNAGRS